MADSIELSVVVPAYCEEHRLGPSLDRIREYLGGRAGTSEIIVVDDGSSDRTNEVAMEHLAGYPNSKVLRNQPNAGKGYSVRRGMLAARGEYTLFSDADLSTPIEEFDKLMAAHAAGAEVAIGSRAMRGSNIEKHQKWTRELAGRLFNLFIRSFIMHGIHDTQCGFKSFHRSTINPIFGRQTIDRWGFDVELLYIAKRLGFTVAELPVTWVNDEASKINAMSDGFKMLGEALTARRLHKHLTPADRDLELELPDM